MAALLRLCSSLTLPPSFDCRRAALAARISAALASCLRAISARTSGAGSTSGSLILLSCGVSIMSSPCGAPEDPSTARVVAYSRLLCYGVCPTSTTLAHFLVGPTRAWGLNLACECLQPSGRKERRHPALPPHEPHHRLRREQGAGVGLKFRTASTKTGFWPQPRVKMHRINQCGWARGG